MIFFWKPFSLVSRILLWYSLFSKIIKFSPYPIQAEWALDKPNTFFEVAENPNKRLDFVFFQFVPFSITPSMGCLYDMHFTKRVIKGCQRTRIQEFAHSFTGLCVLRTYSVEENTRLPFRRILRRILTQNVLCVIPSVHKHDGRFFQAFLVIVQ